MTSWLRGLSVVIVLLAGCGSGSSGVSGGAGNCSTVCPGVLAAHCTSGPTSESDCESGCSQIRSGTCSSKWDALMTCGGSNPKFTCLSDGNVSVAGCDTLAQTLYTCLAGG